MPGGIDYAMLFAVKHGWMPPLKEKEYNAAINVWFRAPFLVCTACLAYVQNFLQAPCAPLLMPTPDTDQAAPAPLQEGVPTWVQGIRVFLIFLCTWNALYFMERVVGNY